jgi:hypothetical protein
LRREVGVLREEHIVGAGQFVHRAGCSQAEFCASFSIVKKTDRKAGLKADWKNDEPTMSPKNADCTFDKRSKSCQVKA